MDPSTPPFGSTSWLDRPRYHLLICTLSGPPFQVRRALPMSSVRIICFGSFKVDLDSGELLRNGSRIRLQSQPFEILSLLLQRPAEVVTREEIRQKLWRADTFVDVDHSLGTAI